MNLSIQSVSDLRLTLTEGIESGFISKPIQSRIELIADDAPLTMTRMVPASEEEYQLFQANQANQAMNEELRSKLKCHIEDGYLIETAPVQLSDLESFVSDTLVRLQSLPTYTSHDAYGDKTLLDVSWPSQNIEWANYVPEGCSVPYTSEDVEGVTDEQKQTFRYVCDAIRSFASLVLNK